MSSSFCFLYFICQRHPAKHILTESALRELEIQPRSKDACRKFSGLNQGFQTLKAGNQKGFRVCPQGRLPTAQSKIETRHRSDGKGAEIAALGILETRSNTVQTTRAALSGGSRYQDLFSLTNELSGPGMHPAAPERQRSYPAGRRRSSCRGTHHRRRRSHECRCRSPWRTRP